MYGQCIRWKSTIQRPVVISHKAYAFAIRNLDYRVPGENHRVPLSLWQLSHMPRLVFQPGQWWETASSQWWRPRPLGHQGIFCKYITLFWRCCQEKSGSLRYVSRMNLSMDGLNLPRIHFWNMINDIWYLSTMVTRNIRVFVLIIYRTQGHADERNVRLSRQQPDYKWMK